MSAARGPTDPTVSSVSSHRLSSFQSSDRDYSTSSYSQRPISEKSNMSEAESMLIDVDAARYSSRWKVWRRTSKSTRMATEVPLPSSFRIVTWNVDFNTPNAKARLKTALQHIQGDVLKCKGGERPPPCCILLQEILRVSDFLQLFDDRASRGNNQDAIRTILDNEWIQQYFVVSPRKVEEWPANAYYGNVTLTSRAIPVCAAYSLEFESKMNRNALLVDLKLCVPVRRQSKNAPRVVTLRVGNTHLESLPQGAEFRPRQLGLVTDVLEAEELFGGIVCGDMNNIGPTDQGMPEKLGLIDAYREGEEEEEEGYTWGYQPSCEFPPGRLDKILYTAPGDSGVTFEVDVPERIGLGLKTPSGHYASDHCGLTTTVRVKPA